MLWDVLGFCSTETQCWRKEMTLRTSWRRGGAPATWDTPSGVTLLFCTKGRRPPRPACWRHWCFSLISCTTSSIRYSRCWKHAAIQVAPEECCFSHSSKSRQVSLDKQCFCGVLIPFLWRSEPVRTCLHTLWNIQRIITRSDLIYIPEDFCNDFYSVYKNF